MSDKKSEEMPPGFDAGDPAKLPQLAWLRTEPASVAADVASKVAALPAAARSYRRVGQGGADSGAPFDDVDLVAAAKASVEAREQGHAHIFYAPEENETGPAAAAATNEGRRRHGAAEEVAVAPAGQQALLAEQLVATLDALVPGISAGERVALAARLLDVARKLLT